MNATDTQIARSFVDGANSHNLDGWRANLAPDFVGDYPLAQGLDADHARVHAEMFLTIFPDITFVCDRAVTDGDSVAMEWTASGTHLGPMPSPTGDPIPATGRSAMFRGLLISTVRDGRIVYERNYWNPLDMFVQLGLG